MINFTKEIKLSPEWQKKYRVLQPAVYLIFLASMFYFAYLVLFPSMNFSFSFQSANALKNTIVDPRDSNGNRNETGRINEKDPLFFNINPLGEFSRANLEIDLEKDSAPIEEGKVSAKKSYRAFFYPIGSPIGLPDGTLVKNGENYFLVSQEKLRKFSGWKIATDLGYGQSAFVEATDDDLKYNEKGADISDSANYPDDSLFLISGDYYQMKNQKLSKYASEKVFLQNHRAEQALTKNATFLDSAETSEDFIGFPDGTLVSFDNAVSAISSGKSYPIDSVFTFESLGFSWNDVVPASEEEIGVSKKNKLFTINLPHPNGFVFLDRNAKKYYYIQDFKLRELKSPLIIKEYTKNTPIIADSASLTTEINCEIKIQSRLFNRYGCALPIIDIQGLPGNSFQFETSFSPEVHIKTLSATYEKNIDWKNMRSTLSSIKNRIILQYAGQN
jgi:hypothetical protein